MRRLDDGLRAAFARPAPPYDVVVFDGDSIAEGYGTDAHQSFPRQTLALLERRAMGFNAGLFGAPLENKVESYAATVAPLFDWSARSNILLQSPTAGRFR